MTEQEWDELKDRELDERLTSLFKSVERPRPLAGFVTRTMKAVRQEPLPASRRPLRNPMIAPIGWAALIAGATAASYAVVVNQPVAAEFFASLVAVGIRLGAWLVHFVGAGLALSDLFTATGRAVGRAVASREGFTGLMAIAATGALALSALHRLLIPESEASRWQELS
jgi:hypothetical protein